MRFLYSLALIGLFVGLSLFAGPVLAQWSDDPGANLVIADRPDGQAQPKLVPTDDGGFYVGWFGGIADGFDVYLQRLDADGVPQWQENGIRVVDRSFSSTEDYGLAVGDDGHAYLAYRFPDGGGTTQIVVNRVSPEGQVQWGDPGVFASSDASGAASPRVAAVGDGAVIVAWTSFSTGTITLQKVDANGVIVWTPGSVTVNVPSGVFFIADLHADGDGNVIVSGSAQLSTFDRRLWAQKVSGVDGSPMWGDQPVEVFNGSDGALQFGYFPPFVPDGSGGAVFAWYQVAGAGEARVRVQHVESDGTVRFPQNGVDAATGTERERLAPAAAFDASSGDIYVVWPEEQQPSGQPRTYGVSAQRIDADGNRQWGDAGQTLVPMDSDQATNVQALLIDGGAVFAWALHHDENQTSIRSTRVDPAAMTVWISDLKTSASSATRIRGSRSVNDYAAFVWANGPGPVCAVSCDGRSDFGGVYTDIRGQNVGPAGQLGPLTPPQAVVDPTEVEVTLPPNTTASATIVLSNTGGSALDFSAAFDDMETVLVDFEDGLNPYNFTLGIPAADYIDQTGGNPGRWFRNSALQTFAPSLYILPQIGSPYLGNFVERQVEQLTVDARTVSAGLGIQGRPYSLVLTNYNGEPNNVEAHYRVYFPGPLVPQPGQGWEKYVYDIPYDYTGDMPEGWGGGYYGDPENLPPGVTFQDVISQVDDVRFMWGHPAYFYLLQDFDIGVDNVGVRFPGEAPDVVWVEPSDGTVPPGGSQELEIHFEPGDMEGGEYVYDLHIETNDPENPLLVVQVTMVVVPTSTDGDGQVLSFGLSQNYPNPFRGSSVITFTLPEAGDATIEVFDVLGRRVATLLEANLPAGEHQVTWDATTLPAGTYLYRLHSGARSQALRAMILR